MLTQIPIGQTAPNRIVSEWTDSGIDGGANEFTHRLIDELDCDGLLSGSKSLQRLCANNIIIPEPSII